MQTGHYLVYVKSIELAQNGGDDGEAIAASVTVDCQLPNTGDAALQAAGTFRLTSGQPLAFDPDSPASDPAEAAAAWSRHLLFKTRLHGDCAFSAAVFASRSAGLGERLVSALIGKVVGAITLTQAPLAFLLGFLGGEAGEAVTKDRVQKLGAGQRLRSQGDDHELVIPLITTERIVRFPAPPDFHDDDFPEDDPDPETVLAAKQPNGRLVLGFRPLAD